MPFRGSSHSASSIHFFFSSQEYLSDREQGQSKLNAVVVSGELICSIAAKDKVDAIRPKMNTAREDWKNMMSSLHNRETNLQVSTLTVSSYLSFLKSGLIHLLAKEMSQ